MQLHVPPIRAKKPSETGKNSKTQEDYFAANPHVSSLTWFKKQKCLICSIKDLTQSNIHHSIEKMKNRNDQSINKETLDNAIQCLISTDETVTFVKYSWHIVMVKDRFLVLEEDTLTKAVHLSKHLKNAHSFHRVKPKRDSIGICTNMRILRT